MMSHPRDLHSFAHIAEDCRAGYSELRRLVDSLGLEPELQLNGVPYYGGAAVATIRRALSLRGVEHAAKFNRTPRAGLGAGVETR